MEVLRELAKGQSNKQIAKALEVTEGTVKIHLAASSASSRSTTARKPCWWPEDGHRRNGLTILDSSVDRSSSFGTPHECRPRYPSTVLTIWVNPLRTRLHAWRTVWLRCASLQGGRPESVVRGAPRQRGSDRGGMPATALGRRHPASRSHPQRGPAPRFAVAHARRCALPAGAPDAHSGAFN